jgi:hypothetical protein
VYRIKKLKSGQGPTKSCRSIDREIDRKTKGRHDPGNLEVELRI